MKSVIFLYSIRKIPVSVCRHINFIHILIDVIFHISGFLNVLAELTSIGNVNQELFISKIILPNLIQNIYIKILNVNH